MRKKVTSTDIAKAAGVSQATVSMVLNKKYNVSFSKETIQKVEQAAQELGYTLPGRKNRKNSKNSRLIVVFCPTLTNPYYVMLLQGIETVAKEKGYGVFVCNTQRELKIEEQYLRMMYSVSPAGIIYTCNPSNAFMEEVEELAEKIPLVVISNRDKVKVDAINQDNTKVGRLMARHLLDLGHRKVAFIAPPLTKRQEQRSRRVEGFVREFERAGLGESVTIKAADDHWDEVLPSIDSEYRIGYNLTKELLAEGIEVTAIAGLNDMIAFGIIDAVTILFLRVCPTWLLPPLNILSRLRGETPAILLCGKSSPQAARIPKQNLSARIISSTSPNSLSARPQPMQSRAPKRILIK